MIMNFFSLIFTDVLSLNGSKRPSNWSDFVKLPESQKTLDFFVQLLIFFVQMPIFFTFDFLNLMSTPFGLSTLYEHSDTIILLEGITLENPSIN